MIPQNLKIIQLTSTDGVHSGLYMTTRDDIENFQSDFDAAFSDREVNYVQDNADSWLESHKEIFRAFAEEVVIEDHLI